ncbi:MAG: polysaccharide deacetylase family protein [Deltaproteobacteria bacterium]|nr:polysaccharide deacetylase family protein [Deltaproteobacteria bacterium]
MSERLACVSIDLDGLDCYARIFALHLPPRAGPDPLHTVAVHRFGELLAEADLPGTAFVIGSSLTDSLARKAIAELHRAGHELGNHSFEHDYRLSLRSLAEMRQEVEAGAEAIAGLTGERPVGFRAPGYNLSAGLLQAVRESGATYDTSLFPSAPYLAARGLVLGAMALGGRPSASHAGPPAALLAPRGPYRPHPRRFWQPRFGGGGPEAQLLELPITVWPLLGLPFIGGTLTTLPWRLVREGLRALRRRPFLNLELHALDLLDRSDGLPPELARRQRDLMVPAREKARRLREVLAWMKRDHEIVRLDEAAQRMA